MKKFAVIACICLLALGLCACSSADKLSDDPLVAKWALKYDEGKSQVLFNFEDDGNLDVVIWHYDEELGDLKQAEDHMGNYKADKEAGTVTYETPEGTYVFDYAVEAQKQLTVTYEDHTFTLPFIEQNYVID